MTRASLAQNTHVVPDLCRNASYTAGPGEGSGRSNSISMSVKDAAASVGARASRTG